MNVNIIIKDSVINRSSIGTIVKRIEQAQRKTRKLRKLPQVHGAIKKDLLLQVCGCPDWGWPLIKCWNDMSDAERVKTAYERWQIDVAVKRFMR